MQSTIFEVLDSYFGSRNYPSAGILNNGKVRQIRERIISFYETYQLPHKEDRGTRFFLGSFLSSPPFTLDSGPYLASALLCADSVVVFDPLHHWFCDEQYKRVRLMSAPPGWKTLQKIDPIGKSDKQLLRPDYPATKRYLSGAIAWLTAMRPLIDAGLLVLVPAERIVYANLSIIKALSAEAQALLEPVDSCAELFSPDEITVDDNRKGLFLFAGGDQKQQINKYISQGLELFAKDVEIANSTHSLYTAPFRWEQHLGERLLSGFATSGKQTRLVEGIRNLRLPILANLSPELLVKIHRDSGYASFRSGITEVLQCVDEEVGSERFQDRVHQIEQDILFPKVEAIQKEVASEAFRRITNAAIEGALIFGQIYVPNMVTGVEGNVNLASSIIGASMSVIKELMKRTSSARDHRIWASLVPESPNLAIYGSTLALREQPGVGWPNDPVPSMTVKISKGGLKIPFQTMALRQGTSA
jgi:hypothetical protein